MAGPKTREEAVALREVRDFLSGDYFLGGCGISGDSICAFVDDDGMSKSVRCIRRSREGSDEWVKVPL